VSGNADWLVLGVTRQIPVEMAQLCPKVHAVDLGQTADLDRALSSAEQATGSAPRQRAATASPPRAGGLSKGC